MDFIKRIVKKYFSKKSINILRNNLNIFKVKNTRKIIHNSDTIPGFLEKDDLEVLQKKYPFPPEYGYDKNSLEIRGIKRAKEIFKLQGAKKSHSFLEIGCWDGMVSGILCRNGKDVTAIDKLSDGLDERAINEGIKFFQMDASDLQFEDESYDFLFSYDSFEHFSKPEKVLTEAIRVVKKGGYIFLSFGPLYYSPLGEHAYRSITVPYCQILFPKDMLNNFAEQNGLALIDFNHVNGWSFDDYESLWTKYNKNLKVLKYDKFYNLEYLDLIKKHPSCFKDKSLNFNNFIVSSIDILFKKIDY
jgi:ubiquinone/menaquinone biosynthesis C-methylase UbiE